MNASQKAILTILHRSTKKKPIEERKLLKDLNLDYDDLKRELGFLIRTKLIYYHRYQFAPEQFFDGYNYYISKKGLDILTEQTKQSDLNDRIQKLENDMEYLIEQFEDLKDYTRKISKDFSCQTDHQLTVNSDRHERLCFLENKHSWWGGGR